jgi:hypothetical protein
VTKFPHGYCLVSLNTRLPLFTLAITCLTAALFGMIPALSCDEARTHGIAQRWSRADKCWSEESAREALVIAQIAFSLVFEGPYTGNLDAVLPAVRRAIHDVDPNLPISNVTTLEV